MEEDKQYIKADGNYFIYRLIPEHGLDRDRGDSCV